MTQTILIIIGVAIAVILLARKPREQIAGICAAALDQTVRKNANMEKALAFIREKGSVSNEEIRERLGVSSRTAVRYLDELEKEGKVEQVGKVGHAVTYRLK
ncbi:MAG: HTH domain-containing protein [bacterium]|nr:HTH domain-containing protein [bacterium]